MTTRVDVLVIGGGMAGLAAAITVCGLGKTVLVLERAGAVGGSAVLSSGYLWSTPDIASLRREDPGRYQTHGHLVVDGYASAYRWLTLYTQPITGEQSVLAGRGFKFDMTAAFTALIRTLYRSGGTVEVNAEVRDISRTAEGYRVSVVSPVQARTVTAAAVVLATGGRQGSETVRRSLVDGDILAPLRANGVSCGFGAELALSLGGAVSDQNRGFYGHLLPCDVTPLSPAEFSLLAMFHSEEGVLLDRDGRRFANEAAGDHKLAMALAAHGGTGLLLWSEAVQKKAAGPPVLPGDPHIDRWAYAHDRCGRVCTSDSYAELANAVHSWGYEIPSERWEAVDGRLGTGRVFAVEVIPAITFTFGGIKVDASGHVIDSQGVPIPGLFAAGADMSDIYHEGYGGGLSAAIVTGRRAGTLAAQEAGVTGSTSGRGFLHANHRPR